VKKILIIDDESEYVNDLARGLTMLGYEPFKAEDGEGGLAAIGKEKPDIALCDYILPDIDGDIVLKRAKDSHPDVKFVMVTAYYDEKVKERLKRLGADEVIYKPLDLKALDELLKDL